MGNRNRLVFLAFAVALAFTLSAGGAMAKGPGRHDAAGMQKEMGQPPEGPRHGGGGEKGVVGCVMKLDLSTEALEAVESLLQAQKEAREEDREVMAAAHEAYVAALTASEIDEVALEEAQAEILFVRQAHAEERFVLEKEIVALLTAGEVALLAECLAPPEEVTE